MSSYIEQIKPYPLVLRFSPNFPSESVKGRQFELIVTDDKVAWQIGRGSWCWPRFTKADRLSRAHCTIYWNPNRPVAQDEAWDETAVYGKPVPAVRLGCWEILDGGVYPPDKREVGETADPRPSSLGIWHNGYRILPGCPERLQVGSRIAFGLDKAWAIILDDLNSTDNDSIWFPSNWPEIEEPVGTTISNETKTQLGKQVARDELDVQKSELVDKASIDKPFAVLAVVVIDFLDWIQSAKSVAGFLYRLAILFQFWGFAYLLLQYFTHK
jgi:pSer/pThr/pTyr-binding forkhead associated (FHA) protein